MRDPKKISLILTYLVVAGSYVSLYGLASTFYIVIFATVSFLCAVNDFTFRNYPPRWILTALGFIMSGFFILDLSFENLISPFANILVLLIAIKALEDKKPRDIYQMLLLSLFGVALSATFRFDISFLIFFLYELFLGTIAFLFTNVYSNMGERKIGKDFISTYTRFALLFPLVLFILSVPFFVFLPRTHTPLFDLLASGRQSLTSGIAQNVELGKVGEIQQDNTVVMRVYGEVPREAYWRVAVFNRFTGTTWLRIQENREGAGSYPGGRRYRYRVILSPTYDNYVPLLDYPLSIMRIEGYSGKVVRTGAGVFTGTRPINKPIRYIAVSTEGRPSDVPSEADLKVPSNLPESIWDLSKELSRGKESPQEKVKAVIEYFKNGFKYSLKLPAFEGNPLEHFLFRSKSGNCEFFASSTAILLRMMGIPARLVGGFKGYIKNDFGDYYIVTNSMAHVWVEAYLGGRWIRIDTTPPYRSPGVRNISTFDLLRDAIVSFWFENVVEYSARKQAGLLRGMKVRIMSIREVDFKALLKRFLSVSAVLFFFVVLVHLYLHSWRKTPANLYRKLLKKLRKISGEDYSELLPEEIIKRWRGHDLGPYVEFIVRLYQRDRFSRERVGRDEINEGYRVLRNIY